MRDLRRERERLGLRREEVAEQTRIPVRYLVALEEGEDTARHPGPFLFGYRKQYEAFLDSVAGEAEAPVDPEAPTTQTSKGLSAIVRPEEGDDDDDEEEAPKIPVTRLVVGGFMATLIVALLIKVGTVVVSRPVAAPKPPPAVVQTVELRSTEAAKVAVKADGRTVFSGTLDPGETKSFQGHSRLEVDTSDLTRLTIHHDGDRIEPLGNLTTGRRLVFIQEPE